MICINKLSGYLWYTDIRRFLLMQISKALHNIATQIFALIGISGYLYCKIFEICINKNLRIYAQYGYPVIANLWVSILCIYLGICPRQNIICLITSAS